MAEILLHRLSEGSHSPGEREKDLRNLRVVDRYDTEVGGVEDVIVDDNGRARFLLIAVQNRTAVLPMEAVSESDADTLYVSQPGERILNGPAYNPTRFGDEGYWLGVYDWYDYRPYWTPG